LEAGRGGRRITARRLHAEQARTDVCAVNRIWSLSAMNDNPNAAIEQARAVLQNQRASAAELKAAAEAARVAVRAIDEAIATAPLREEQVLRRMTRGGRTLRAHRLRKRAKP
jgi:hypothetical protein